MERLPAQKAISSYMPRLVGLSARYSMNRAGDKTSSILSRRSKNTISVELHMLCTMQRWPAMLIGIVDNLRLRRYLLECGGRNLG